MNSRPRINFYTIVGSILILGGLALAAYPFTPLLWYQFFGPEISDAQEKQYADAEFLEADEELTPAQLPAIPDAPVPADTNPRPNKLVIPKIGVDMHVYDGPNAGTLERGGWRLPQSKIPSEVGNTIFTGHRYKYRPPSTETFYLLDKLNVGDTFIVYWNGGEYRYRIDKKEVRPGNDLSILEDTSDRRVTLITCDPLFSTKNRLVVSGRLLKI